MELDDQYATIFFPIRSLFFLSFFFPILSPSLPPSLPLSLLLMWADIVTTRITIPCCFVLFIIAPECACPYEVQHNSSPRGPASYVA
ncbi:hypothetical protein I7I53_07619 [Histoplasma capsulatum var. duboisii H88]|uniref:Uncharacterized protein n=1 Tax=Ajellomyces capsulatus (strain H88) TaxID=544711 RepID=A0A8A1LDW2_AJEC8|nr:hypothetical protein I7I53_07619 [Histoplasma capsulatum var. duboisii H88]